MRCSTRVQTRPFLAALEVHQQLVAELLGGSGLAAVLVGPAQCATLGLDAVVLDGVLAGATPHPVPRARDGCDAGRGPPELHAPLDALGIAFAVDPLH
jgi:hypothetical protein